jgi:hypothetical protein
MAQGGPLAYPLAQFLYFSEFALYGSLTRFASTGALFTWRGLLATWRSTRLLIDTGTHLLHGLVEFLNSPTEIRSILPLHR